MSYFSADADASELITSQRRDDEQIQWIYDRMSDCVLRVFGERIWISYHRWLPSLAAFIYLSATNLREKQSVGEEYVGLVQIGTDRRFPSLLNRLLFVFFEVISRAPLLNFLLLQQHPFILQMHSLFHPVGIDQIHSAWFFLSNSFFLRLSKRLASIRYLSLRPQPNSIPNKLFQLVGFATFVQFVVVLVSNIAKLTKKTTEKHSLAQSEGNRQQKPGKSGFSCKICSSQIAFGQMRRSVCLPCGHCLCSDCLLILSSKDVSNDTSSVECPFCRIKCPSNRILFPLNL
ncbi:hypothetical protein niasHS_006883 [Heterodera schachtii]|uniref:RING-type E3 ubiquitin transferase n=1 Tax=Heterodera schachtii TaxID=97005 RepID=A0ABD2JG37_HETSC